MTNLVLEPTSVKKPKVLQDRPYQSRISSKVVSSFVELVGKTKEASAVMVDSPTGSGKTVMGFKALKDLTDNHSKIYGRKKGEIVVNWCAMRRNLLAQAEKENNLLFGVKNVNYISMFDKNPPKCDILVFDECQHSCANSAVDIYTKSDPKSVLGLSATPYRADRQKLCFHKVIRDAGYRQLIHDGYLSQFDQYMIPKWSVELVTKTYLNDPAKWGKSVAFFLTVEECYQAMEIVSRAGFTADVVTGDSPREAQLEAFEAGKIDILFNVYVLSEGFDCPELKTVFCRPSSKGPTIQMCGRAFRKFEGKVAQVVQSTDTGSPFAKFATPQGQFVLAQDLSTWRTIGVNNAVNERFEAMRRAVMAAEVDLPQVIIDKARKVSAINGYLDHPGRARFGSGIE